MGSGASLEPEPEGHRYFCHACSRGFICRLTPNECIICGSSFIEEMTEGRGHYHLNEEQARRLTNAAALLHLLELQLRDELDILRSALSNADNQEKNQPLTQFMKDRLRTVNINVNMMCEQPSCPICSEEYTPAEEVIKLPCAHIYHGNCVMPWLDSKKTCPICRFEFKNEIPTNEEIDTFTSEELKSRIHNYIEIDDQVMDHETRQELAKRYLDIIKEKFEESQTADNSQNDDNSSNEESGLVLRSRFPHGRAIPLRALFSNQMQIQSDNSPSLGSDPRSFMRSYRDALANQSSNRGIIRQLPDDISNNNPNSNNSNSSNNNNNLNNNVSSSQNSNYETVEGDGVSGTMRSYRVITNPQVRQINETRPNFIQLRSFHSDGDDHENNNRSHGNETVRIITYPTQHLIRSMGDRNRSTINSSNSIDNQYYQQQQQRQQQPVTFMVRRIDPNYEDNDGSLEYSGHDDEDDNDGDDNDDDDGDDSVW